MNKMIFALSVLATATVLATDGIDFSANGTTLRPLLHSTCFNANVKDHNEGQEPYLTNGGFASSETILWSEGDFNQRVTDLHHIFPLVGQDADDAANYFFKASDRKMFYANRCNLDVMYRLGSAKESAGYNAHTLVPADFVKTANVMSHIISHYTASKWADGVDYSSRITRWEIWSGPDDPDCWWAPEKTPDELKALFTDFFVTCLKKIKADHPEVKVGGPALSKWDPDYMAAILDACDAEGVYPDFISYQCYTHDADALLSEPATIRAWLDARGANYANCEIILSAWHYLPDAEGVGTLTQLDMDKVHEASLGEGGTMTATAAAFNLAVLSGLQNTPLARAYHGASTAFSAFSPFHWSTYNTKTPHVAANAFKLFGTVTKDYTRVLAVQNDGAKSVLAVANDAGTKGALLVTDSSSAAGSVEVRFTGLKSVSGLASKVVNAENADVQTLSSGVTLTATGATITKAAGPQAYLMTFDMVAGEEPEPVLDTYYMVGQDPGGQGGNSWTKSCSSTIGWKKDGAASVDASHAVSASGIYVLGNGTILRSPHKSDAYCNMAFAGAQLILRGGELALQSEDAANTVTVPRLVAEGGKIIHYTSGYDKTLNGGIEVRNDGLVVKINSSPGQRRNLTVASTITGTGPISLMGGGGDSDAQYLEFTGDMSEFTGTITESDSSHMKNQTLRILGSFGGTITKLPAGVVMFTVNYAGLPTGKGVRVATTTIPTPLKAKLTLFGATDFTTENLPLITFPAGTTVDPAQFTVKYAATVDGEATAFEHLGTVENGDGTITLVANKPVPPPSAIEIPTGANLTYNGQQQTGVAAGVGYTLSGTLAATAVGSYTATATLDDPETTKWADETTEPKTINWSITKAANSWATEPSLSKTSWPANRAPATLNVGAAAFGTMTATLNNEPFNLANPVFPTEEGEYTLVITVAGSNDYGELVKEITFTITAAVASQTHYMVGKDADKTSSFVKSSTSAIGWATSQGGTVDADHEVNADDDYIVPSGTLLRTLYDTANEDLVNVFKGASLTLAGELNLRAKGGDGYRKITVDNLIANGGTITVGDTKNHKVELAGAISLGQDKSLTLKAAGGSTSSSNQNLKVSAKISGSGKIYTALGTSDTKGEYSILELAGDMSGFSGEIEMMPGATKYNSWTFMLTGPFGGVIRSVSDRNNDPRYVVNYGDIVGVKKTGVRIANDLPACFRYRTAYYNVDPTKKNLALLTLQTSQKPSSSLQISYGASASEALSRIGNSTYRFGDIGWVDHDDGTSTAYANYVGFTEAEISGEITMAGWTEGETPSEPSGLTVTPAAAQDSLNYKYYKDSDCTQALSEKPDRAGTYYVRGEVAEGDDGEVFWTAAASEPAEFTIELPAEAKTRVNVPEALTLPYTGAEQVGVTAGDNYTRSGVYAATEVGEYEAIVTLPNEEDYEWNDADFTTGPKTLKWFIVKAENAWMGNASISKTSWKSTETPGEITPPTANFGTAGMKAQISKNGGAFEDWDGTMPTEKGKYTIRWTVADTDSYSALEDSVKFLIDYRYEPTAPFMYTSDNGQTWKGATTIDDACKQINGSGIVEVCEDVSVSALTGNLGYKTVTLRSNVDEVEAYAITLANAADFTIQNGGRLILTNIVFNLSPGANVSRLFSLGANNSATANLEIHAGTVISGATTSSLIAYNYFHGTVTVTGGAFKDFTCGGTILSASAEGAFAVSGLTIENCTANELIGIGNKTLNLSNVKIANNTTTAGAITVGAEGKVKVSGDVIVSGNKVGDIEKNIVPNNAANLVLAGDLGENARIGVSFGSEEEPLFGSYTAGADTANKFVNDANPTLLGIASATGALMWPHNIAVDIPIDEVKSDFTDLEGNSLEGKTNAEIREELKKVADNGYTFAENIELGIEQVKEGEKNGNFVAKPYLYSNGAKEKEMTFAFGNIAPKVSEAKITYTIESANSPTAADDAWQPESSAQMTLENQTGTATLPIPATGASAVKYYRVRFTVEPK